MCIVACERGYISGCRFSYFSGGDKQPPELKYVCVRRPCCANIEIVNKLSGIEIIFWVV